MSNLILCRFCNTTYLYEHGHHCLTPGFVPPAPSQTGTPRTMRAYALLERHKKAVDFREADQHIADIVALVIGAERELVEGRDEYVRMFHRMTKAETALSQAKRDAEALRIDGERKFHLLVACENALLGTAASRATNHDLLAVIELELADAALAKREGEGNA